MSIDCGECQTKLEQDQRSVAVATRWPSVSL